MVFRYIESKYFFQKSIGKNNWKRKTKLIKTCSQNNCKFTMMNKEYMEQLFKHQTLTQYTEIFTAAETWYILQPNYWFYNIHPKQL